jgi:hypothetical protein
VAVGRLKALFFLPSIAYFRAFEGLVTEILAEGQGVLVALDRRPGLAPADRQALDHQCERHGGFGYVELPSRAGMWRTLAGATSRTLNYLRLLEPKYAGSGSVREDARARTPRAARVLLALPPFRWAFGRRALAWTLRGIEAGIPLPRAVKALVSERSPGLVVVAPSENLDPDPFDYVRTAEAAGIPSVVVVGRAETALLARGLSHERIVVAQPRGANGSAVGVAPGGLEAIERAARTPAGRRRGQIARPLLWLLSPLLTLGLVVFRPRASGRALVKGVRRVAGRARKRARAWRRRRVKRARARAKAKKHARSEAARERKAVRARVKADRAAAPRKVATERATRRTDAAEEGHQQSTGAPNAPEQTRE